MLKRAINRERVLGVVLLTAFPLCLGNLGQGQEQKTPQQRTKEAAKKDLPDEKDRREEERVKQAQTVTEGILFGTNTILNPVARIRIRMLAADAYWEFQPAKARQILSEEFPKIALIAAPQNESDFGTLWSINESGKPPMYKGRPLDQVKAQLRREMLATISARDSTLARTLVAAEKAKETKSDPHTQEVDEVLSAAQSLAETDPEAAARIIKESLKTGVSDGLVFSLMRLRETSPAEASAIFNQLLSAARATGDLWEFQQLLPYILPTEVDQLVAGKHYLTEPQRMKDANTLMEYAADLLYRRILTDEPNNLAPDLARKEYYLWRNLLGVFNDLKPESVWLVNTRLRQLTAALPQGAPGPAQSPWSEEKLNEMLAKAKASFGETRDEYFSAAAANAWRFGQGDLDRAVSIAENIENREFRDPTISSLYFQAGLKNLRTEGPDYALDLARKVNFPVLRTRLYLAIIGTLSSVKAVERAEALREELLNWLRNSDKNSDTASALLEYLDSAKDENTERSFAVLEAFVRVLNSPSLDPVNKLKSRHYWYAEFHNFRKSLAPLAKADFDRSLEVIQMVTSREAAMQIQAALCGDYLRIQSKAKKSSTRPIPRSE
jgi:hypothetical protein